MSVFLRILLVFSLMFSALTLGGTSASSQTGQGGQGGQGVGGGGYGGADDGDGGDSGVGLSSATTGLVVRMLRRGIARCQALEPVYRYDCYRQTYGKAADQMAGRPAYAEARAALVQVERTLEQIVARNTDPHAPPLRRGTSKFTAIRPASVPGARAELIQALDEAETLLLRSSGGGAAQFARIAAAINSNKVLLRS